MFKLLIVGVVLCSTSVVMGQSSSLMYRSRQFATTQPYITKTSPLTPSPTGYQRRPITPMTDALQRTSLTAVVPTPPKTFKVHDLITVIVLEQKKYEADAKTDNSKEAEFDALLDAWFRVHDQKWKQQDFSGGKPHIKGLFAGEYQTDGKSEREDKFTTRITGRIIDVKPNGNLVVEATAAIQNDDELQTVTLTGTCRSLDVTPDNTILSSQLANKDIVVKHEGAVRDATKRGLIPRLLDKLMLF